MFLKGRKEKGDVLIKWKEFNETGILRPCLLGTLTSLCGKLGEVAYDIFFIYPKGSGIVLAR